MAHVWTRRDWNDLIGRINALADRGCSVGEELPEVGANHLWSVQDITVARDKLTEICANAPTFSAETILWTKAIIDELNEAIENCQCAGCPTGLVDGPEDARAYEAISTTLENLNAPLTYESEGTVASSAAEDEWDALNTLLSEDPSQAEVNAQLIFLNLAADIAWGYLSAADTMRVNKEPVSQWLDPGEIHTANPALYRFESGGTQYRRWKMCQTTATVRVEYHRCFGDPPGSYLSYADEYHFAASPSGSFFLTGTSSTPRVFAPNEVLACLEGYVGEGDCEDVGDCVAYLEGLGLEYRVTVSYETTELSSAAWPE